MDEVFSKGINHVMLSEVGPFWDPTKRAVVTGVIESKQDKIDTGYVNDPKDSGGETKFGIAKNSNPELDIAKLNWDAAKRVYYKKYWLGGDCADIATFAPNLAMLHLDGCVNHGVGRAAKMLQEAVGATIDGDIGPNSLLAIKRACGAPGGQKAVCEKLASIRVAFYNGIVSKKPDQVRFLKGWLLRISNCLAFVLVGL